MSNANEFVIESGILKRYLGSDVHVIIPDQVKTIGNYAFGRRDEIYSVQLPESVTKISDNAFRDCTALEKINIPAKVKTIGAEAFRNCRALQKVVFGGTPEKIGVLAFYGCWKLVANKADFPENVQQFFTRMELGEVALDEAKKLYGFSKAKGVASIKEFQGVYWISAGNGTYAYHFNNRENSLIIPEKIGELPVVKAPCKSVPDDAIIYCNSEYFGKLPRGAKANTAVAWLAGDKLLKDELTDQILTFIKKYADDVAYAMKACEDPAVYRRFLETAKPKAALIEKLVEQSEGKPEILAVLLNAGSTSKQKEEKLTLDDKPKMTVTELKKLWTYQNYIIAKTGEKIAELTNYKGHDKHVVIPAYIGKNRVAVVRGTFPADVETVEFPNEEMEIKCSFRNCRAMTDPDGFVIVNVGSRSIITDYVGPKDIPTLRIPAGATENMYAAFKGLRMREVVIPEGFLKLAGSSFSECERLQKVQLPESLQFIGDMAFQNCDALRQIYIPKNVTDMGILDINRYKPENLTVYGIGGGHVQEKVERCGYTFAEGAPAEVEMPDFVIVDGELRRYIGDKTDVVIPDGVTAINGHAFNDSESVQSIIIPDSVERLQSFAFADCSGLVQIKLSAGLREIPDYAFMGCTALKMVTIPQGVTAIGGSAFSSCRALAQVSLPEGLKTIGEHAFSSCFALSDISIPATVEAIGEYAFQNYMAQQKTTIHAPAGSFAETYARENGISFVAE